MYISLFLIVVSSQIPNCTGKARYAGYVGREVTALLVLSLALGAVDALPGQGIADRLEQTSLADLTGR